MSPSTTAVKVSSTGDSAIGRLFEVAREGVYIGWLPAADLTSPGDMLVANPCLRRMLGYESDTVSTAVLLFAPSHYVDPSAREQFVAALHAGQGVVDYLVQLRRLDGRSIWVEINAFSEPRAEGGLQVDALVRDVTERRQLEERARDLYQQLAHSEQLAAISRTLADVAHELRNPLATIVAWSERLAQHTLDDKTGKGVSEILAASERAARIVRGALHSVTRQQSTRRLVDINEIVQETLALRRHDHRSINIIAKAELGAGLPCIFADPHQIQQVLLNVVINAEHAMSTAHGRGTLTVRTSSDGRRQMVILEVSDDGPGVPESARSRIFDPFFTTKQVRSGTGLGLAVAQALVHEHGGNIRLAHDITEGATFVIELPTRDPAAAAVT